MKVTAAAILWIAVFVLATSCGSSDASRDSRANESDAGHRAESIVLAQSDFPAGWKAASSEQNVADGTTFRECISAAASGSAITDEADSVFFGDTQQAWSGATVFAGSEHASDALQGMKSPVVAKCFREFFQKGVADAPVSIGKVRAPEVDMAIEPKVDGAKEWQIATSLTLAPGQSQVNVTNRTDLYALQDGDMVVILATDNGLFPMDAGLRDKLVKALAERLTSNSD